MDQHHDSEEVPGSTSTLWDAYRSFVHRHRTTLELMDAGISRILFWTPSSNAEAAGGENRQREVFYGILSLHRLAMDTALQQQDDDNQQQQLDYGTTVRLNPSPQFQQPEETIVSPTTIRIGLTVIQSLLPSLLEIASSPRDPQRRARMRLYIERVKFALRLVLLGSYWNQLWQQQRRKQPQQIEGESNYNSSSPPLSIGLLTDGGLFHGLHHHANAPTLEQEDLEWEKLNYVGRRTGRKVTRRTMQGGDYLYERAAETTPLSSPPHLSPFASPRAITQQLLSTAVSKNLNLNHLRVLSVVLGELLYAFRPLYWASTEASGKPASYRSWLLSIMMDLVSLQCCRMNKNNYNAGTNKATQVELKRRKMKLLLYLLRAPVWDDATGPASDQLEAILDRVPLLGRLISTYLRDWLWYMKHPYVSEEG